MISDFAGFLGHNPEVCLQICHSTRYALGSEREFLLISSIVRQTE